MKTVSADIFKEAMRLTASGVAVITTDGPAGKAGLTVSSLCSLSMEPPSVIISVKRDSATLARLLANGVFVANVLASPQSRVADAFAGLVPELREDRFSVADWDTLESGLPILPGAVCNFDCEVADVFDFGSHRIVVGAVTGLRTAPAMPLVFSGRAYHELHAVR